MKKLVLVPLMIVLIVALIFGGCAEPAPAPTPAPAPAPTPAPAPEKPIELSMASFGGPPHFNPLTAIKWEEEITERTSGRVKFTNYWGGSLLKAGGIFDGVVEGAADIGLTMPAYGAGRFPVAEFIELPHGYPNSTVASQVAYDVFMKFKPAELKDVHFLFVSGLGLPLILSAEKPIRTLDDMKGLKARSTGNTVKIIEKFGAATVSMPMPEVYDAFRKGMVDFSITGSDTLELFKLAEVVKYVTYGQCIGYTGLDWKFMNHNSFNSLPADIQQIFTEVSAKYSRINGEAWDAADIKSINFAKGLGVEFLELPAAEQEKCRTIMKEVVDEHLAAAEAKGLPVKELASFIEESIKKIL